MFRFIKIFTESVRLAFQELLSNKLRTILSVSGISIGIFCIITIFTGVDFLKNTIDNSIKELGQDVVYVEIFPWDFSESDYPWWEYIKRPAINYDNYEALTEKMNTAKEVSYCSLFQRSNLKSETENIKDITVRGVTSSFAEVMNVTVAKGRFISEIDQAGNVVVLGKNVADELFEGVNPIGQYFRLNGKKVRVIGTIDSSDNLISFFDYSNEIFIPNEFAKSMYKIGRFDYQFVALKAKDGISVDEMRDEIRGILRGSRKLHPVEEDNFALNRMTMILDAVASLKDVMRNAGIFLGIFSLLVGGFGVANIMFVSVRERTKYIGIKKAIGAKRSYILLEFLIESIVLCIIGSLVGLFFVFLLVFTVSKLANLEFALTFGNIAFGMGISIFIGVIAGIIPAIIAALMNPVKAIRS